jgi:hypothetical protein
LSRRCTKSGAAAAGSKFAQDWVAQGSSNPDRYQILVHPNEPKQSWRMQDYYFGLTEAEAGLKRMVKSLGPRHAYALYGKGEAVSYLPSTEQNAFPRRG